MLSANKANSFMQKLLKETRNDTFQWSPKPALNDTFEPGEFCMGDCFYGRVGPDRVRLAKVQFKYWNDESDWDWDSKIVLDFVTDDARVRWRFPPHRITPELYELVQFEASNVEETIDIFLDEK